MRNIIVKTHPSSALLKKEDQLAWKIAEIAADKSRPSAETIEMVINRMIDNASVAIASLNRKPVISARDMALSHPRKDVQRYWFNPGKFIVNGLLGRMAQLCEVNYHDTFLAQTIVTLVIIYQQYCSCSTIEVKWMDLIKGIYRYEFK